MNKGEIVARGRTGPGNDVIGATLWPSSLGWVTGANGAASMLGPCRES